MLCFLHVLNVYVYMYIAFPFSVISHIHTQVFKPFPIHIYSNMDYFPFLWTVKNVFDADPFNLDQKAVRRVFSIWI